VKNFTVFLGRSPDKATAEDFGEGLPSGPCDDNPWEFPPLGNRQPCLVGEHVDDRLFIAVVES
jgi:hypothetical protein